MARIIARQKSRAATLRTTRERFIGIDRRKGRERKELSFYAKQGCTVKVVESVGSGYLSSHLYSLTSMSTFGDADVFFVPKSYAANPNDLLYCAGLIPPNDSLILSSLYQWM